MVTFILAYGLNLSKSLPLRNHSLNHISVINGQNFTNFKCKVPRVRAFQQIKKYSEVFECETYANLLRFHHYAKMSWTV